MKTSLEKEDNREEEELDFAKCNVEEQPIESTSKKRDQSEIHAKYMKEIIIFLIWMQLQTLHKLVLTMNNLTLPSLRKMRLVMNFVSSLLIVYIVL